MAQTILLPVLLLCVVGSAIAQTAEKAGLDKFGNEWPSTDFSKSTVEFTEIDISGMPKDGIPSISRPRFVSIKKARKWIANKEPVLVVADGNKARAYPLQILVYHQIINDTFLGKPIVITFCPLCNNGLVMSRKVGSKTLTFGTTGLLRKSGLVMYDRQSQSWWQQFTGTAIVGDYAGQMLQFDYTAQLISLDQFAQRYPSGKVMSRDTGFRRKYGLNPFQGYDSIDSSPLMFPDKTDPRLPAMERVLNVAVGQVNKLYPYSVFGNSGVVNDIVNNTPVAILSSAGYVSPLDKTEIAKSAEIPVAVAYETTVNEQVLTLSILDGVIVDKETGSKWNIYGEATSGTLNGTVLKRAHIGTQFAFAALAFLPNAEIYSR